MKIIKCQRGQKVFENPDNMDQGKNSGAWKSRRLKMRPVWCENWWELWFLVRLAMFEML